MFLNKTAKLSFWLLALIMLTFLLFSLVPGKSYLDKSFGVNGKQVTNLSDGKDVGYSLAIQSDNKIIAAGWTTNHKQYYALKKMNVSKALNGTGGGNRSFDASFTNVSNSSFSGTDLVDQGYGFFPVSIVKGKRYRVTVTLNTSTGDSTAQNIITSNGTDFVNNHAQLIVNSPISGFYDFVALTHAKYIGFGTIYMSGELRLDVTNFRVEEIKTLVNESIGLLSDNGSRTYLQTDFAIVRYNIDGSLDTSFNENGIVKTDIGPGNDQVFSVVVQNDGKIVTVGVSTDKNKDVAVVRYLENGKLDTSFGANGIVVTKVGLSDDYGYSVALQKDSKIIVAGHTYNGSNFDLVLIRYNSYGLLDPLFGENGIVTTAISLGDNLACCVLIQRNGKILIVGTAKKNNNNYFSIRRYEVDGNVDVSYGDNGYVLTNGMDSNDSRVTSAVLQQDGKLLVVGYNNNEYIIARYLPNGDLDNNFGEFGVTKTKVSIARGQANGVALQSDGKIIVVGKSLQLKTGMDITLVRYNSNGTLDADFSVDGILTTDINLSYDVSNSIVIQKDGKAVVVGYTENSSIDFTILRFDMK